MIKVPAVGPRDADIAIVGEGPGRQEERDGEPFVGRAGYQLDQYLTKIGLPRDECFITNATKRRPQGYKKGKKMSFFFKNPKAHTDPTPVFIEGLAELQAELEEVQPNVVLGFGNIALWALTGNWGIYSYHGSILESNLVPGQKTVCTIHPASVVRGNYKAEPLIIWDMTRAKEEMASPEIILPERNFIIFPRQSDIDVAVQRLLAADTITVDTEWYDPDTLACIGFTDDKGWAICIPVDCPGAMEAYDTLLDNNIRKVWQNAMFDCRYLLKVGVPVRMRHSETGERIIEDTMVAFHVSWPELRNRLENQTAIYTREPYYKDELDIAGETGDRELFYTYNCKDTAVEHEIWECHENEELPRWGTRRAYELNMATFPELCKSSVKGIRADFNRLMALKKAHLDAAEELQELLDQSIGYSINTRSYPQVGRLVYDQLGIRERAKRKTDRQTLMDIAAQETDHVRKTILTAVIGIREHRNAVSKYINESLVDRDGRIRSSWNMAGTKSGRLSASKDKYQGTGASLQTFPEEARLVCIPDEGHVFLKPDLAQAESLVTAYYAHDYAYLDWVEEGLDTHAKLASMVFNVPYEEISKGTRQRYLAKRCRHGLNYLMGPRTMKLAINEWYHKTGFGVTEAEVTRIRNSVLEIHSALKDFWSWVEREVRGDRKLKNPLGRQRHFIGRWSSTLHRECVSFLPQSTVADITHIGLARIARELPEVDIFVNAHDGSLLQVPEDRWEEYAARIVDLLHEPITIFGKTFAIPVEVEMSSKSWGEMEKVA